MGEIIRLNERDESRASLFSPEAEQQVLGALLLDNARVGAVVTDGGVELFYDPVHRAIFERIAQLDRDEILASPVTLREWAGAHPGVQGLGGAPYLVRLAGAAVASSQLRSYCQHLAELRTRRDILAAIDGVRTGLIEGKEPAANLAGRLEASLSGLEVGGNAPRPVSMLKAVTEAAQAAWDAHNGEVGRFVPTGIHALDRLLVGLFPGDLVLLGGRPSMGKTAVAINAALNAARAGSKVAFISLEMGPDAIAMRALSEAMAARGKAVAYRDLRAGRFQEIHRDALAEAMQEVSGLPIHFLPREYQDIGAMTAGLRKVKAIMGGLDLVVVDYAQLMRASQSKSRYEVMTEISTALKRMAITMDVPVLALSQLSRQVEQRDDKRPQMSDLRESGQLEQDADTVLFCYRDEYYIEREKPSEGDKLEAWQAAMEASRNRLEIIVGKQRQGPIGTAHVLCNVAFNRIWEA